MKTTVEISDALLAAARKMAARHGTTLRELIEEGLRRVVQEQRRSRPFKLRNVSFKGKGLRAPVAGGPWDRIRDLIYEDRGA